MSKISRGKPYTVDRAASDAWVQYEYWDGITCALRNFSFAFQKLNRQSDRNLTASLETLIGAASREAHFAIQAIMMFAVLLPKNAQVRKAARELAYHRFLKDNVQVMGMFEYDGIPPGQYFDRDEKTFRRDLARVKRELAAEEKKMEQESAPKARRVRKTVT